MGMSMFEYASYVNRIHPPRRPVYDIDKGYGSWRSRESREEDDERIRKEEEKQRIINSYPKFRILFIDGFRNEHVVGKDLYDSFKEAYDYMKVLVETNNFPRWYNKPFNRYIHPPYKENIIIQQVEYGWNTSICYDSLKGDSDVARLVGKGEQMREFVHME